MWGGLKWALRASLKAHIWGEHLTWQATFSTLLNMRMGFDLRWILHASVTVSLLWELAAHGASL